jgi:hypothetical protein
MIAAWVALAVLVLSADAQWNQNIMLTDLRFSSAAYCPSAQVRACVWVCVAPGFVDANFIFPSPSSSPS